jgi:glyoxylase-like metal-dependent hydrolase (beta-lactamase superfamily II)
MNGTPLTRFGNSRAKLALMTMLLSMAVVIAAAPARAAQEAMDSNSKLHIYHVQGNVYMFIEPTNNITVQIGEQYVIVVDTGVEALADDVIAGIRSLTNLPIMFVVNTGPDADHVGGNTKISQAGWALPNAGNTGANPEAGLEVATKARLAPGASITGYTDNIVRTTAGKLASNAVTYGDEGFTLSNKEPVLFYHLRSAHTDGDSVVFFRRSDVISVGELFSPDTYPVIDTEKGGTLNGLIDAVNDIIVMMVPEWNEEGGTYAIPGHGHLCDRNDVVNYRDMLTIVRGRVQDLVRKGMKLDQVKAAKPTFDYDKLYGSGSGAASPDKFIETVYHEVAKDKVQQGKK